MTDAEYLEALRVERAGQLDDPSRLAAIDAEIGRVSGEEPEQPVKAVRRATRAPQETREG